MRWAAAASALEAEQETHMYRPFSIALALLLLMVPLFAQSKEPPTFLAQYPAPNARWSSCTATRRSVCLNGLWHFVPAGDDLAAPPGGPYYYPDYDADDNPFLWYPW
jgi:hypothetical protein